MSYSRSPRAVRSMTVGTRGMRAPEPTTVEGVPPALSLRGLSKTYDDGFTALEDFDLDIPVGAFFGLLGPNGAGRTTLISAVCNLIRVTAGEVRVFGHDHDTMEARRLIGLAEQDINRRRASHGAVALHRPPARPGDDRAADHALPRGGRGA